jgi:hypothetical protein
MTKPIDVYKCVVAGVATKKGVTKVRFARDMVRVKGLVKDGQTGVDLVEMPQPMGKGEAVQFLLTQPQFTGAAREAIEAADIKYSDSRPAESVIGTAVVVDDVTEMLPESDTKFKNETAFAASNPYDAAMLQFMNDENAVVKSFKSVGGKGLAGFIESLAFDWYDKVTWNVDTPPNPSEKNSQPLADRAPKMCKITISFSPIHDITPGLDYSGVNRAPIYPVGVHHKVKQ